MFNILVNKEGVSREEGAMSRNQNFEQWIGLMRDFLGDDFWTEVTGSNQTYQPKADVLHSDHEVVVLIDIPGIQDVGVLDIRVEGETLYVRGEVPPSWEHCEPVLTERFKGKFERVIPLGEAVRRRPGGARYRKGVLEIRLTRLSADRYQARVEAEEG